MAFRTWDLKDDKWETRPAGVDPGPMTEGRRKTLEMVMDAVILKTKDEIIASGFWQYTEEVKIAEATITEVYLRVLDGSEKLSAFQEACDQWKKIGTKRKERSNHEPPRPAAD